MSRKVRCAAALLVVGSLSCGSLGALPLGPRVTSAEGSFLVEVVEWIISLLVPDRPTGEAPQRPDTKAGSGYDPNGGPG